MGIIHLEYKEELSSAYARNYLEIYFDEENNVLKKVYLYNSQYGTITVKNNKKEVHKWETESVLSIK